MYHESSDESCANGESSSLFPSQSVRGVAGYTREERNTKPEYIGPRRKRSPRHPRGQIVVTAVGECEYPASENVERKKKSRKREARFFPTANMYKHERKIIFLFLLINHASRASSLGNYSSGTPTPVVLWHGMGDSCCFSFSLGKIKAILEEHKPGIYVKSVRIGDDEVEDVENSYWGNANDQVAKVCDELSKDDTLRNGYHAIGFSQGSQFLRAVAQRCPSPPMKNLISLGGQHQGVYGLPNCPINDGALCKYMSKLITSAAYTSYVQKRLLQAEYWHDPLKEETYKQKSIFLADINNERSINESYRTNLQKLERLVLVKFTKDTMVQPRESQWFGYYTPGQAIELQTLQESAIYLEDRLGLRRMDDMGKIFFLSVDANHLQFTDEWFVDQIVNVHL